MLTPLNARAARLGPKLACSEGGQCKHSGDGDHHEARYQCAA